MIKAIAQIVTGYFRIATVLFLKSSQYSFKSAPLGGSIATIIGIIIKCKLEAIKNHWLKNNVIANSATKVKTAAKSIEIQSIPQMFNNLFLKLNNIISSMNKTRIKKTIFNIQKNGMS